MALPEFNEDGDLPIGVHSTSLTEIIERFGTSTPQRAAVVQRLTRIHELATETGYVLHFIVFGSFVTSKPDPNDVDISS